MRADLERMREWANEKLKAGQEPPWAWYQYMKLRETLDQILAGMDAVTTENLPQSAQLPGKNLRLVDAENPQDSAPRHFAGLPTQLPT